MNQNAVSPSLPLAAQLGGTLVLTALLLVALRRGDGLSGRFVIFACWFRLMLSAFHQWTFDPLAMGLSINALGSAAIFGLGLVLLEKRLLLLRALIPIYLLIFVIVLSTAVNARLAEGFDTLVKFGYLSVLALHCFKALQGGDGLRFTQGLLLSFSPLPLFQLLSILLGVYKAGEIDGSASYVGGYNHEGHFAMGLMGLLVVASLATGIHRGVRFATIMIALVGIYLANYRTAILGALPILALLLASGLGAFFPSRLRSMAIAVAAVAMIVATTLPVLSMERFADLRMVVSGEAELFKPPEQFTRADRRLLSGRSYVWSQYYYGWKDSGATQHIVGLGPDSWQERFKLYAHNSFVDFLYEYGIAGVLSLLVLLLSGLLMAMRAPPARRPMLVAAHVGFLLLNMATMPMWQIEGLILYGLILGFTIDGAWRSRVIAPATGRTIEPVAMSLRRSRRPRRA